MMDGSTLNMEDKLPDTSTDDKKRLWEILEEERKNGGISYRLRPLKDKDLFPMLNILKKAGIKDLKSAFVQDAYGGKNSQDASEDTQNKKSIKDIGLMTAFDLVDILLGNLPNIEDEVYDLWSDISGIPVDEMKEQEFGTLPLMIADTFAQAGNNSFFRVLSRYLS